MDFGVSRYFKCGNLGMKELTSIRIVSVPYFNFVVVIFCPTHASGVGFDFCDLLIKLNFRCSAVERLCGTKIVDFCGQFCNFIVECCTYRFERWPNRGTQMPFLIFTYGGKGGILNNESTRWRCILYLVIFMDAFLALRCLQIERSMWNSVLSEVPGAGGNQAQAWWDACSLVT